MVDFSELVLYFVGIFGAVLSAVLSYWLKKAADKFGIETDEKMNGLINEAIERGLGFAAERLSDNGKKLTRSVKNEFVEEALQYTVKGVPKSLRKLGLTQERVREMIEARLVGQVPEDEKEENETN